MSLGIRDAITRMPASKIREVAELGLGREDVIPLWFGESDEPTPDFIKQAAKDAIDQDRTTYGPNSGLPALREAIARYCSGLYGKPITADQVTVTASGMQGIMLTMQALVEPGDNVVAVGPCWPNILGTVAVMGGEPREVCLDEVDGAWSLDVEKLFAACDGNTRAVFLNSPGNPTGWMISREQQQAILDFCRARGIWILGDDVYARMVYAGGHAPCFLEIAEAGDKVISINSFSKAWQMTGWRLGWVISPANLVPSYAMLNEFNIASPAPFVQLAGVEALDKGEAHISDMMSALRRKRDFVCTRLAECPTVRISPPDAAFYAFFAVEGMTDSLAAAKALLDQAGVGLAPGIAFGANGEGYLRLCFAASMAKLEQAMDKLVPVLKDAPGSLLRS